MQVYVNDIIFGATNESLCKDFFYNIMKNEFKVSITWELQHFVQLQIYQSKEKTFTSQAKYYKYLLKRFDSKKEKPFLTRMSTSCSLDKDERGKTFEEKKHQGMIGSLIYLTPFCHDITFLVCLCTHFKANPR